MVDELLALYTKDRPTRLLLYACIFLFSLSYGVVNSVVLNRAAAQVSREVVVLIVILAAGLPTLYVVKRGPRRRESLDYRPNFQTVVSFAATKPGYEASLFGAVALADRRRAFIHEELMHLREQFSMEYAYRHEPGGLKSGEPFVIEHEYQAGRMLSVGAVGAVLLSAVGQFFVLQSWISFAPWLSAAVSLGISLGEFYFFRAIIAAFVGSTRKPSRLLSRIATGSSAAVVLLLLTLAILRSVPNPYVAIALPVFAMLSVVLPFCAGSLSVAAEPLLWSRRLVGVIERKQRELERVEYEFHTLARLQEQFQRTEDAHTRAPEVRGTGEEAPPYASLP
ncbi:MAG: hypothetical protein LAQ69_16240 [Acidobacteriia bacterium]|nr:hypothetical protein [Terriglobia bacterium]